MMNRQAAILVVSPSGVVRLSDVGTVPNGYEALEIEGKLLATASQF